MSRSYDEERKEFWTRVVSAEKYSDQKKIAVDFGDPVQYLYFLLLEKIEQNSSQQKTLQTLLNKVEKKPNNFRDVLELYSELMPIMTEEELNEFIDSCNSVQKKPLLTPGEKNELYWYSRCIGPLIGAYERGKTCRFLDVNHRESVYPGANKTRCEQMFRELKFYYKDVYLKRGEPNIRRSIAVIDRAINNSSPLEKDTMLYRGLSGFYTDNELQSIEELWLQKGSLLINDNATLSTSLVAEKCYTQHKYVLQILAPAGTKGIYLEPHVNGYYQQEFLLPRNTTIKIFSIALDDSTGKITLTGEIVSQKLPDYKLDKSAIGTNNVVDRLGIRHTSFNDSINGYNDQFNELKEGIDITDFIDVLTEKGLLDKFYFEVYDMDELYKSTSSGLEVDSLFEHAQRVMLYSLYIGNHLGLDNSIIKLLLVAAKYHAVSIEQNINGTSTPNIARAEFTAKCLKHKYSEEEINIISALIECLSIDDKPQLIKIFNKYGISEKYQNIVIKALSVLKDAITLDKTRLQNGLDIRCLRNTVSFGLAKTSYQIQEIKGKTELDVGIRDRKYSDYELKQIEQYRIQGIPEYIIFNSMNTFQQEYNSVDEMIDVWMKVQKNKHKFDK